MSCAPRSAPEPDSQSPKNKHTEPSQPEQPHTSMPATPALCRSQHQHTRSLTPPLNLAVPNAGQGTAAFSMMTNSKHLPKQKPGGGGRDRTDDPLLAKQVLSQLSYAPNAEAHASTALKQALQRTWWAREDSNLRPHAYQACALTN